MGKTTKTFISIYWYYHEEPMTFEVLPETIKADDGMITFQIASGESYAVNKSKVTYIKFWEETDETQS